MTLTPDEMLEQSQWDFFWAPSDAVVVDRPEVLYVHCPRDVPHLNTVTRVHCTSERFPALLDEVMQAHRGRRSRWPVLSGREKLRRELHLARAGYEPGHEHYVYAVGPAHYRARPPAAGITVERVDTIQRLRDCEGVRREAFGEHDAPEEPEAALERDLEICVGPAARVARFVAYDAASSEPVSSGCVTIYSALRFGLFWAGCTVPAARGRGAYSAIVASRVEFARRAGVRLVGLYARVDTSAQIVARQGFEPHGGMVHWNRPTGTEADPST
ncbi:MAG: hypothetical protein IPG96_00980 [Proteobacteria bacterium]|nr:hypothetical protein [Pseudomonadota bacterium]